MRVADSEGDAAYHALESALYRLRQLLGARDAVLMEAARSPEPRSIGGSTCGSSRRSCSVTRSGGQWYREDRRLRLLYQGISPARDQRPGSCRRARNCVIVGCAPSAMLRGECERARRWEDAATCIDPDRADSLTRVCIGLDALPPAARRSRRGAAGVQALSRVG